MGKVREVRLTLPIYYTQEFKTKKDKTFLVGLNWYRNSNHYLHNTVKVHYHELVLQQIEELDPLFVQFEVHSTIYWKNKACDPRNVAPVLEKYLLDALQLCSVVTNDSALYDMGGTFTNGGQDKEAPRIEFVIKEVLDA